LKKDVLKQLKQDRSAYCSTMLDFHGLGNDFPGLPLPANLQNLEKVLRIEQAVKADIVAEVPDLRPDVRFFALHPTARIRGAAVQRSARICFGNCAATFRASISENPKSICYTRGHQRRSEYCPF